MKFLDTLIGGAVTTASDAAAEKAAAQYERFKPLIYLGAFMAATVYLFYFVPRFFVPGLTKSVKPG